MAAPMDRKSGKNVKKFHKKLFKLREILQKKEHIRFLDDLSNIICVCNGGLDNNVTAEEMEELFSRYGGQCKILMLPQKSYCYVNYDRKEDGAKAVEALNGYKLSPTEHRKHEVILYTLFVSAVPDNVCPSRDKPPGLILIEDFITENQASEIIASVNWDATAGQQKELKHRRVKHYGYEFKYSINNVDPDEPLTEGIPDVMLPLLEKLRASGVINHLPDQLTVNEYQPGQGIPPHVDTPSAFEDGLVSLSIGSQVLMEFRHPDGRHLSVLLPHRSVLVMTGESRYVWTHGITPRKSDIVPLPDGGLTLSQRGVRTSFTFRKITGVRPQQEREKPCLPIDDGAAAELEKLHVYEVYEKIAEHFSGTRHTPWPRIADFLNQQPTGSLLVDIGCGNGKYFGINNGLYELGSDRSFNLAKIVQERQYQVYVGDVLAVPLREAVFDVCMCIAVIHHLSTQERRRRAVCELLKVLRPGGKALIYVWAIEQELNKVKSKYLKSKSKTSNGDGDEETIVKGADNDCDKTLGNQTVEKNIEQSNTNMERSNTNAEQSNTNEERSTSEKPNSSGENVDNRQDDNNATTHDLSSSVKASDSDPSQIDKYDNITTDTNNEIKSNAIDKDDSADAVKLAETSNTKLEVHVNRTEFKQQDILVPWQLTNKPASKMADKSRIQDKSQTQDKSQSVAKASDPETFHRFYHVFQKGELERLCESTNMCKVIESYYDQGNWAVVLERT